MFSRKKVKTQVKYLVRKEKSLLIMKCHYQVIYPVIQNWYQIQIYLKFNQRKVTKENRENR